ncbi:MAG: hypothetical protein ACJ8EQ_10085, partial [Sphingomicrobium sp.]
MRPPPPSETPVATGEIAAVSGPITDGTVLQRAPEDVGGLLDTSKGWTLRIPGPDEAGGAAAKAMASQQTKAVPAPATAAAAAGTAATQVASR